VERVSEVVRAAGGIVSRTGPDGVEVLVVHRPTYDDWSLPKGKADPGESDEECAVREVEEETGLRCSITGEVGETRYVDARGRDKIVRYFAMEPTGGELAMRHEVDDARWVGVDDAGSLLTYERDRDLLSEFARSRD
jgi:8-oxo-dGTP diphosphatase